jgi:hypothetical protein
MSEKSDPGGGTETRRLIDVTGAPKRPAPYSPPPSRPAPTPEPQPRNPSPAEPTKK